jgi:magnesium-transporting ATPase (P-type)
MVNEGIAEEAVRESLPVSTATWDAATPEHRIELLHGQSAEGEEEAVAHEGASEGIVGLVERVPRSIAFTILAFTQMFEVMAIHAGDHDSFFRTGFKSNRLLLWAVLSTFALQLIVLYVPFMQTSFETTTLSATQMLVSCILGSVVLFAVEIEKYLNRSVFKTNLYVDQKTQAA